MAGSLVDQSFTASLRLASDLVASLVGQEVGKSTKSGDIFVDAGVFVIFTLASLVFILVLRHCILNPLASRIVLEKSDIGKFGDSGTEFVLYAMFAFMGMSVVLREPWMWPSSSWWDYPAQATMTNGLRCWYILDAGRYTASLISLVFFEHKRKDFLQMFVHHVVTIVITAISYLTDYNRVGAIVKVVMDPADVPLHGAKLFKVFMLAVQE
jgi:ceramide synthetase